MLAENPREIAWHLLNRWSGAEEGRRGAPPGGTAEDMLERSLKSKGLEARDRRLVMELFWGSVRRKATLDWLIA